MERIPTPCLTLQSTYPDFRTGVCDSMDNQHPLAGVCYYLNLTHLSPSRFQPYNYRRSTVCGRPHKITYLISTPDSLVNRVWETAWNLTHNTKGKPVAPLTMLYRMEGLFSIEQITIKAEYDSTHQQAWCAKPKPASGSHPLRRRHRLPFIDRRFHRG